ELTRSLPSLQARAHTISSLSTSRPPPTSTLFPYTTLFRSVRLQAGSDDEVSVGSGPVLRCSGGLGSGFRRAATGEEGPCQGVRRSEEHTSELQSRENLVCRLLLEKKKSCDQDGLGGAMRMV